jgi:hypothetical protein
VSSGVSSRPAAVTLGPVDKNTTVHAEEAEAKETHAPRKEKKIQAEQNSEGSGRSQFKGEQSTNRGWLRF